MSTGQVEKTPETKAFEAEHGTDPKSAQTSAWTSDFDKRMEEIRKQREMDIAEGKKIGQEFFGEEKLGRAGLTPEQSALQADILAKRQAAQEGAGVRSAEMGKLIGQAQTQAETAGQRSADIADIIARRKSGLEGFSAEENAAQRAAMLQGVGQAESTAMRQLRGAQAQAGVRGGLAGAQQMALAQQAAAQRAVGERDIFLRNMAEKQARLGSLEQSVTGAEATEFGRGQQALQFATGATSSEEARMAAERAQALSGLEATQQSQLAAQQAIEQFNLQQQQKEAYGQLAAQLGFAQMGAGERAALMEQLLGEAEVRAQAMK